MKFKQDRCFDIFTYPAAIAMAHLPAGCCREVMLLQDPGLTSQTQVAAAIGAENKTKTKF